MSWHKMPEVKGKGPLLIARRTLARNANYLRVLTSNQRAKQLNLDVCQCSKCARKRVCEEKEPYDDENRLRGKRSCVDLVNEVQFLPEPVYSMGPSMTDSLSLIGDKRLQLSADSKCLLHLREQLLNHDFANATNYLEELLLSGVLDRTIFSRVALHLLLLDEQVLVDSGLVDSFLRQLQERYNDRRKDVTLQYCVWLTSKGELSRSNEQIRLTFLRKNPPSSSRFCFFTSAMYDEMLNNLRGLNYYRDWQEGGLLSQSVALKQDSEKHEESDDETKFESSSFFNASCTQTSLQLTQTESQALERCVVAWLGCLSAFIGECEKVNDENRREIETEESQHDDVKLSPTSQCADGEDEEQEDEKVPLACSSTASSERDSRSRTRAPTRQWPAYAEVSLSRDRWRSLVFDKCAELLAQVESDAQPDASVDSLRTQLLTASQCLARQRPDSFATWRLLRNVEQQQPSTSQQHVQTLRNAFRIDPTNELAQQYLTHLAVSLNTVYNITEYANSAFRILDFDECKQVQQCWQHLLEVCRLMYKRRKSHSDTSRALRIAVADCWLKRRSWWPRFHGYDSLVTASVDLQLPRGCCVQLLASHVISWLKTYAFLPQKLKL